MARPREFDTDQALRAALDVFWRRGFDGASLVDLADAMGIVRPSLQAAFGSKEELYRQAIRLYDRDILAFVTRAIRGRTAAEVCRRYLAGYCDLLADPKTPPGCFMTKALASAGRGALVARQEGANRLRNYEDLLEQRFVQARDDGDLPAVVAPAALAQTLKVIALGLAVRADAGAPGNDLRRVAEFSLHALLPG